MGSFREDEEDGVLASGSQMRPCLSVWNHVFPTTTAALNLLARLLGVGQGCDQERTLA